MKQASIKPAVSFFTDEDRRRRKREIIIILCILVVVALLTFFENRVVNIGEEVSLSSTLLMFTLININLLLLILLYPDHLQLKPYPDLINHLLLYLQQEIQD